MYCKILTLKIIAFAVTFCQLIFLALRSLPKRIGLIGTEDLLENCVVAPAEPSQEKDQVFLQLFALQYERDVLRNVVM